MAALTIQTQTRTEDGGACEQDSTLQYSLVLLIRREFLLPSESELEIYHQSGMVSANATIAMRAMKLMEFFEPQASARLVVKLEGMNVGATFPVSPRLVCMFRSVRDPVAPEILESMRLGISNSQPSVIGQAASDAVSID